MAAAEGGPQECRAEAERLAKGGDPLRAYDLATEGLTRWPGDLRLRQLQALALATSGAPDRAAELLRQLEADGADDEETLGLLARTQKDAWAHATDPGRRAQLLDRAFEAYQDAYRRTGGCWTGINAATCARLLDRAEAAKELAQAVQRQGLDALQPLASASPERYYPLATLGEAALVLGDLAEAEARYREAAEIGPDRLRDLISTRRNARFLLHHLGEDRRRLDACFGIPKVAVFVGHMVDRPGRPQPRFPSAVEPIVVASIRRQLSQLDARIGFALAACGGDLIFLEAILDLGGQIQVVLPYERAAFDRDSVTGVGGPSWGERYARILDAASRADALVTLSEQQSMVDPVSYEYANRFLHGLAAIPVQQLETDLIGVALWAGRPGDGPGGTASAVERWRALQLPVEVVDLAALARDQGQTAIVQPPATSPGRPIPASGAGPRADVSLPRPAATATRPPTPPATPSIRMVALLFADTLGYSKLTEEQIPTYVEQFLGGIARQLAEAGTAPLAVDTWGDAVYIVFADVGEAGRLALALADWIEGQDWTDHGLPAELRLRIALHAGPAFGFTDPLSGKLTYSGSQVSRAARLEPVTPPGQVYASEGFAALAAAEGVTGFRCEYVGKTAWAKDHGVFATYHLRRQSDANV